MRRARSAGSPLRTANRAGALPDEKTWVIGFRVALGGTTELTGVTPDLTALAKIIGGGFPLGALGGRFYDDQFCDHFAGSEDNCTHSLAACSVRALWGQVQKAVDQVLTKTTLEDLLHQGYALEDDLLGIST